MGNKVIYRAIKFRDDGPNSWAVFNADDIRGFRSPISEFTKAKPLVTNLNMKDARAFVKNLLEKDLNENNKKSDNNNMDNSDSNS